MSVPLSISGHATISASQNIQANLTSEQAKTDFATLCTLVGKNAKSTVQVKLVHTTDAKKHMTFQTKNYWGRLVSKQASMVKANDAILALVKKTGIPETSRNYQDLRTYLDKQTEQKRAGSARGLNALLQAVRAEIEQKPAQPATSARTLSESLKLQGYAFNTERTDMLGSGGHGEVFPECGSPPKTVVYKTYRELSDNFLPRLRVTPDGQGGYAIDRRGNEMSAAYLSNDKIPNIARPLAYVVEDTLNDEFHTISADHIKKWVAERGESIDRSEPGRYMVRGQVLQKAEGESGEKLRGLQPQDKAAIARQGLQALKGMGAHGYVHGDIKPDNLVFDRAKQRLSLIDFGGLKKQSKNDVSGSALGDPASPAYVIPSSHHPQGANWSGGYGQEADLYAFGLTLLELYLPGVPETPGLRKASRDNDRKAVEDHLASLRANTALVKPNSPEDLAVQLMELSIAQNTPLVGRLGDVPGPLKTIWDQIQAHPVMDNLAKA